MKLYSIVKAKLADSEQIHQVMCSNQSETSLFQQSRSQIEKAIDDFMVVKREEDLIVGCAAIHWHGPSHVELLAVSILPEVQGQGCGKELIQECIRIVLEHRIDNLTFWTSSEKADYFRRFGFTEFSKWKLPLRILLYKLSLVFRQPKERWIPAIVGAHHFMIYRGNKS